MLRTTLFAVLLAASSGGAIDIDDPETEPNTTCGLYRVFTFEQEGGGPPFVEVCGVQSPEEAAEGAVADAVSGLVAAVTCPGCSFPQSACQPDHETLEVVFVVIATGADCFDVQLVRGSVGIGCSSCPPL